MSEVAAQGYVYEDGVLVIDRDWVEKTGDIQAFVTKYNFPDDMAELLYLNIDAPGIEWYIEGRQFILKAKPKSWMNGVVKIHYRRKHD